MFTSNNTKEVGGIQNYIKQMTQDGNSNSLEDIKRHKSGK